jgi:hypothetical protein
MITTTDDILQRASVISQETQNGANTALRVGSLFTDITDTFQNSLSEFTAGVLAAGLLLIDTLAALDTRHADGDYQVISGEAFQQKSRFLFSERLVEHSGENAGNDDIAIQNPVIRQTITLADGTQYSRQGSKNLLVVGAGWNFQDWA